jgi:hypothetical protein
MFCAVMVPPELRREGAFRAIGVQRIAAHVTAIENCAAPGLSCAKEHAVLRLEQRSFRAVHARRLAAPIGFELDIRPEYPH